MKQTPPTWFELPQTDSTQTFLETKLREGTGSTLVVWAHSQEIGQGRLGRRWKSPLGGLYLSLSLPAGRVPPHFYGVMAGIVCVEQFQPLLPTLGLKWPNDLLCVPPQGAEGPEQKVGGILSRLLLDGVDTPHVILGIGLNVNATIGPLDGHALPATSFAEQTGQTHELGPLVRSLVKALYNAFEELQQLPELQRSRHIRRRWRPHLRTLGQRVRIQRPNQPPLEGVVTDLASDLALLLQTQDGQIHTLHAGDCFHVRGV